MYIKNKYSVLLFAIIIFLSGCSTNNSQSKNDELKQQDSIEKISDETTVEAESSEVVKSNSIVKDTSFIERYNHEELNNDGFYEIDTFPYYYEDETKPLIDIYKQSQTANYSDLSMVKFNYDEGFFSPFDSWWEKADGYPSNAEVKYFYYGNFKSDRPSGKGVIY